MTFMGNLALLYDPETDFDISTWQSLQVGQVSL